MFTGIVEELGSVVGVEYLGDSSRLTIAGPLVTSDARHGDSIAVNGVCLTVVDVLPEGRFTADVMAETLRRSSLSVATVGAPVNLERAAAVNSRLGGHIVQGHVDGTGAVLSRTPSQHWEVVRIALPGPLSRYVVEKGSITVDGVSLTVSAVGSSDEPLGRRADGSDEPLGRRADGSDEPLGRRADGSDEPLGRRADGSDEPLGRRADGSDEPLGRRADGSDEPLGRRADGSDEPLGRRADGSDWFEVSLIPTTLALTTLGHAAPGTPVNLEVDVIAKYVERLLGDRA